MNDKELEIFGLADMKEALGVSLFENPNIPEDVKEKLVPEKMWTSLLIMTFLKSTDTYKSKKRCYQSSNQSGSALRFAESIQQLPVYQYRYNRNHQCIHQNTRV